MSDTASRPPQAPAPAPPPGRRAASPHVWTATTYFAEGFPYAVVNNLAEVLYRELGASLQAIGLTALLHLPWNLKFLWGPFLDEFATKRRWLVWTEVALVALLLLLALAVGLSGPGLAVASALLLLLALVSATHDIAIDGFYLEGLNQTEQARFVGYRAPAYRLAVLVVAGPLLVAIGYIGWSAGMLLAALAMALLLAVHALLLPDPETPKRPLRALAAALRHPRLVAAAGLALAGMAVSALLWRHAAAAWPELARTAARVSAAEWIALGLLLVLVAALSRLGRLRRRFAESDSFYARAFVDFLDQERVFVILAFVVLFRSGESLLMKMKYPFLRELGMTLEQYGWANGTLGMLAGLLAPAVGGWLIARQGLRRWIWPFVVAQNFLNLLYVGVAHLAERAPGPLSFPLLTAVVTVEWFGAGLGTAVFMVYLMRCCKPGYRAAHYAILSALMSLSFTFAGVASGFLADWLGFELYFLLSFLATIPGMLLIFFLPHLDGPPPVTGRAGAA